ncbi:Histone-lysine N-methyltransferase EZA1 [Podochytrium sp. JEL0797]|nr:Histone-lysine N-methyltransferase EZA1 [Podochytrium sp. JEL0797]
MVLMHTSSTRGRFLTTQTALEADTEILMALPFAFSILDSFKKKVCSTCLDQARTTAHSLRCLDCDQVYFCSRECQEISEAQGHARVCKGLRKLATSKASSHEKSVMKLVLALLQQRRFLGSDSPDAAKSSIPSIPSIHDSLAETESRTLEITDPLVPHTPSWTDVMNLQSHFGAWSEEAKKDWKKVLALTVAAVAESELVDAALLQGAELEEVVMHLVSRIESNGFGVWQVKRRRVVPGDKEAGGGLEMLTEACSIENASSSAEEVAGEEIDGTGVCMGRAVYPLASFFNHSCDPSCETVQFPNHLMFKTRRRIEAGEELTISYIDSNVPLTNRRFALQQDYFFECQCVRCVADACTKPGQRDKISFNKSHGKAPKEKAGKLKKKKLEAKGNVYELI